MITPILVHHIIYLGDDITGVNVGEITRVMEGYFYVTPETQAYAAGFALGDIIVNRSTWPMEMGNRYLIYLHNNVNKIYHFNGELILSAMLRDQIYLLSPSDPEGAQTYNPMRPHFAEWWQAAMDKYGHLEDLPWVTLEKKASP